MSFILNTQIETQTAKVLKEDKISVYAVPKLSSLLTEK
jgi:hypothetical protein